MYLPLLRLRRHPGDMERGWVLRDDSEQSCQRLAGVHEDQGPWLMEAHKAFSVGDVFGFEFHARGLHNVRKA